MNQKLHLLESGMPLVPEQEDTDASIMMNSHENERRDVEKGANSDDKRHQADQIGILLTLVRNRKIYYCILGMLVFIAVVLAVALLLVVLFYEDSKDDTKGTALLVSTVASTILANESSNAFENASTNIFDRPSATISPIINSTTVPIFEPPPSNLSNTTRYDELPTTLPSTYATSLPTTSPTLKPTPRSIDSPSDAPVSQPRSNPPTGSPTSKTTTATATATATTTTTTTTTRSSPSIQPTRQPTLNPTRQLFTLQPTTMETTVSPSTMLPTGRTVRIMPLGDSITSAGYNNTSYRYYLWKFLLTDPRVAELNVNGFDFVGTLRGNHNGNPEWPTVQGRQFDRDHEGHWGWRTEQVLSALPSWLQTIVTPPDIALVHLGTNDCIFKQDVRSTLEELSGVVRELLTTNPNMQVLLAKVIPSNFTGIRGCLDNLNNHMDQHFASENYDRGGNLILVDMTLGFDDIADTWDTLHPNDVGAEKIANHWLNAILATA